VHRAPRELPRLTNSSAVAQYAARRLDGDVTRPPLLRTHSAPILSRPRRCDWDCRVRLTEAYLKRDFHPVLGRFHIGAGQSGQHLQIHVRKDEPLAVKFVMVGHQSLVI